MSFQFRVALFLIITIAPHVSGELWKELEIQSNTSNFLLGQWFSNNVSIPDDLASSNCCAPQGRISFTNNATVLSVAADLWVGSLCNSFLQSTVNIPVAPSSSYDEIANSAYPFIDSVSHVGFQFYNTNFSDFYPNDTQRIIVDVALSIQDPATQLWQNCMVELEKIPTDDAARNILSLQ